MKYGIDLASYQNGLNMSHVADHNSFAIFKATESVNYIDKDLKDELNEARDEHMKIGYYHFARFDQNSAEDEATFFYNTIKNIIKNGETIWLDYEATSLGHTSKILKFIDKIESLFNKKIKCGVYMSESVFNSEHVWDYVHSYNPLWIAKYSEYSPSLIIGFADIWQYTSSYRIDGYNIDRNELLNDEWSKWSFNSSVSSSQQEPYTYLKRVYGSYKPRYASDHEKAYLVTPCHEKDRAIFLDSKLTKQWGGHTLHNTTHVEAYPTKNIETKEYELHVMKFEDAQLTAETGNKYGYLKYQKIYK